MEWKGAENWKDVMREKKSKGKVDGYAKKINRRQTERMERQKAGGIKGERSREGTNLFMTGGKIGRVNAQSRWWGNKEWAAPVGIPADQISGRGRWCPSGQPSLMPGWRSGWTRLVGRGGTPDCNTGVQRGQRVIHRCCEAMSMQTSSGSSRKFVSGANLSTFVLCPS